MPTLVVTDLDSVAPYQAANGRTHYRACMTNAPGAVTSNAALKHWLGEGKTAADLLGLSDADKVVATEEKYGAHIRIACQTLVPVMWGGEIEKRAGRTLEEAFALQNLEWIHDDASPGLKLRIENADTLSLQQLHSEIYDRVKDNLGKTEFALTLIAHPNQKWASPVYVVEGLAWLRDQLQDAPTIPTLE